MRGRLSQTAGWRLGVVVCRWHWPRYAPATGRAESQRPRLPNPVHEVKVEGGLVLVRPPSA